MLSGGGHHAVIYNGEVCISGAFALAAVRIGEQRWLWRRYPYRLGYIDGMLLLLAIEHGSLGTLARWRGMMIAPCIIIFSGPRAACLWSRWGSRRPRIGRVPSRCSEPRPS